MKLSYILIATCLLPFVTEAEWTQFLGPTRTGITTEAVPADAKPEKRWEKNVGIGFSSVSIADGRLYTLGYSDRKETIWCLNRKDGETIWSKSYGAKLLPNLHEGGPAATPTVFGNAVFTLGKEGVGYCLDRTTGEVIWEINLNERFGLKTPEWGYASSALVRNGHLLLDVGPAVCLDPKTGKTIWQSKKYRAGYGSPIFFEHNGNGYYSVLNNDGLVVHGINGSVIDFFKWPTSFETNATTPLFKDESLFISTAYNKGCALLDFDGQKLTPRYENKDMRNHMNNCVAVGDHLIGFDRKAHNRRLVKLRCMERATGKIIWSVENLGCGSLIRADDTLVILSDHGELVLADADVTAFKERTRVKILDGKCWTHPVLDDGNVFARNAAGRLVCYSW